MGVRLIDIFVVKTLTGLFVDRLFKKNLSSAQFEIPNNS